MQLKHLQTLMDPSSGPSKVNSIAFSPDNTKLAVCHERTIWLFDEQGEKRDKFSTKPCDSKYGKKSYHVTGIAFSPDSNKLAVGQSDNILFVYKIGMSFGDKKSICNKYIVTSAVTCLCWPAENSIYFGLACGKVRLANTRTNKSSTVYNVNSYTMSIESNNKNSGILSSHADGQLVRFVIQESECHPSEINGKLLVHPCPVSALAWTPNGYFCGGADRKIVIYGKNGREIQRFDYSKQKEKDFTIAKVSPSGQSVVIGSFNCLRVFNWSNRKGQWEESSVKIIPNLYTITALGWKSDGSKICCGTLLGGVELFDCSLKKQIFKNRFEITHVGLSQAIIKDLSDGRRMVLKSLYGYEIDDIKILGDSRYVVGYTQSTLLLGDIQTAKLSELQWSPSGNEKFSFHNENVAMIFNAGELTLIEYGEQEPIETVRTEQMNPHLISARINERKSNLRKMAYLVDPKTISINDLDTKMNEANIHHDSRIDWLELNEKAKKLLFRDKRLRLFLYDIETETKESLLSYCSYVQWVPGSDVIVAQNRNQLSVWYNLDDLERVSHIAVKGDVINIERKTGKTEIIVQEGSSNVGYKLDEELIEFGTAIDDGDLNRALDYLESLPKEHQGADAMWKSLAKIAMEKEIVHIAIRCFAAVGDIPKVRYLQKIEWIQITHESETGQEGNENLEAKALLAQLNNDFNVAEQLYIENGDVDKAIDMYVKVKRWDDAIRVTERLYGDCNPEMVPHMRQQYLQWLKETNQLGIAGQFSENDGNLQKSIEYYLEAGLPGKAAKVILRNRELISNTSVVNNVASGLIKRELFSLAGELFETLGQSERAMECYRRGDDFRLAVELARKHYPNNVTSLEEEWGDYLVKIKQMDAAINHFIEAGNSDKAIQAAIGAQQWKKAQMILDQSDSSSNAQYYRQIANHYNQTKQFEAAAKMMIKGGDELNAVQMLLDSSKWSDAYEMAKRTMRPDEIENLFVSKAETEAENSNFKVAEELFILCDKEDLAISMYKKEKRWDEMIKLVKKYHPDLVGKSYQAVGKSLADDNQYSQAEKYFINGDDWKAAVNMYRQANLWEDAYRIARVHAGETAEKQLAFLWARSLGGESAIKLLNRLGHVNDVIEIACSNGAFDFAFDIARSAATHKIPEVHERLAISFEDEGNFGAAEENFVKAGKHREAVLMYVHAKDWSAAERVAAMSDDQNSLQDILIGQASQAFIAKEYQKAEAFLLRAERPEIAVDLYKEAGKIGDALRVAKEYAPALVPDLQREFVESGGVEPSRSTERRQAPQAGPSDDSQDPEELARRASRWEKENEYVQAISSYLKISNDGQTDRRFLEKVWMRAFELSVKFLPQKIDRIAEVVSEKLQSIDRYTTAAKVYLELEDTQNAIQCLINGKEWNKAKKLAREMEPSLLRKIEEEHKKFLKDTGNANELADSDIASALEMYRDRGQWDKCLETAKKHSNQLLGKYTAIYSAELIKGGKIEQALHLFIKYGPPVKENALNIYRHVCDQYFKMDTESIPEQEYNRFALLRKVMLMVVENLGNAGSEFQLEFDNLLLIVHYYTFRAAMKNLTGLDDQIAKISTSLLRYTEIIPADKAFYEAGLACRAAKKPEMAMIFMNRFLDLVEAIENDDGILDPEGFQETEIPVEVPLPDKICLPQSDVEEIRNWVLNMSIDQRNLNHQLPMDKRGTFEGNLKGGRPCIVTGYPILGQTVQFRRGRAANNTDWRALIHQARQEPNQQIQETLQFIQKWAGEPTSN